MNSTFPHTRLADTARRGRVAAMTNDQKDRHVLAAAAVAVASHVVTINLRDFPVPSRPAGMLVPAPERFLLDRLRDDEVGVRRAVEAMPIRHARLAHTARELAAFMTSGRFVARFGAAMLDILWRSWPPNRPSWRRASSGPPQRVEGGVVGVGEGVEVFLGGPEAAVAEAFFDGLDVGSAGE
jgi:hypothetical protein